MRNSCKLQAAIDYLQFFNCHRLKPHNFLQLTLGIVHLIHCVTHCTLNYYYDLKKNTLKNLEFTFQS